MASSMTSLTAAGSAPVSFPTSTESHIGGTLGGGGTAISASSPMSSQTTAIIIGVIVAVTSISGLIAAFFYFRARRRRLAMLAQTKLNSSHPGEEAIDLGSLNTFKHSPTLTKSFNTGRSRNAHTTSAVILPTSPQHQYSYSSKVYYGGQPNSQ